MRSESKGQDILKEIQVFLNSLSARGDMTPQDRATYDLQLKEFQGRREKLDEKDMEVLCQIYDTLKATCEKIEVRAGFS